MEPMNNTKNVMWPINITKKKKRLKTKGVFGNVVWTTVFVV